MLFSQWDEQTQPTHYTACDIDFKQSDSKPNNWLLSGQIAVTEANRIDVTVIYYIRRCSGLPKNGGPYCVNVFDLYVNRSDQFIGHSDFYPDPLSNPMTYEKVAEIKQATDIRTSETINILVKEKHVILAFHNYGACSTLFSVKVTYNVCPDKSLSSRLMTLPRTVAPANDSQPLRVKGNCDKDTVQLSASLYVHCESNGVWNTTGLKGRCICKEDMENDEGICNGIFSLYLMKKWAMGLFLRPSDCIAEIKYTLCFSFLWIYNEALSGKVNLIRWVEMRIFRLEAWRFSERL